MHHAAVHINIHSVRRCGKRHNFRAEFVQHRRRNMIRRTVRAIGENAQSAQSTARRKSAFAKLNIAVGGGIQTPRPPGIAGKYSRRIHSAFYLRLHFVRQFLSVRTEKLHAVVVVRIVRRTDNNSGGQPQRLRQIRNRRSRQRTGQQNIHAGSGETGFQRGFHHITGKSRIFADKHLRRIVRRAKRASGGKSEAHENIGRHRRFAHAPPHPIRPKQFSRHKINYKFFPAIVLIYLSGVRF